jgi:hypothetical protein
VKVFRRCFLAIVAAVAFIRVVIGGLIVVLIASDIITTVQNNPLAS